MGWGSEILKELISGTTGKKNHQIRIRMTSIKNKTN
jgi:hypothetical protein